MSFERLMWLCAALFVLFALPLAVLEDEGWRRLSGGLSLMSLGGFAIAMTAGGVAKGEIVIQFSPIIRASQPRTFWTVISLIGGIGTIVAVGGLWAMFFKT